MEARKRYEEREKRREVLREEKRVFKERKKEERLAARELTLLLKEVKEDMELTDHQPLPDIPPVAEMRLPPEAFGNVLMIFEFLHNFGETLGFGESFLVVFIFISSILFFSKCRLYCSIHSQK